jgi:hypothetical protein
MGWTTLRRFSDAAKTSWQKKCSVSHINAAYFSDDAIVTFSK